MNAGLCLLRLDRGAEAVDQFERAVALDAKFIPALRQLVRLHTEAGRQAESARWQEQLRRSAPSSPPSPADPADPINPIDPVDPITPINPINPAGWPLPGSAPSVRE